MYIIKNIKNHQVMNILYPISLKAGWTVKIPYKRFDFYQYKW